MIQMTDEEDTTNAVVIMITTQEEDLQDVLYVTKVIIYVLNVHINTKLTSDSILNVEWVITL